MTDQDVIDVLQSIPRDGLTHRQRTALAYAWAKLLVLQKLRRVRAGTVPGNHE